MSISSVFSAILAIILALTGMCGGLSNANVDKPVAVELNVGLDGDFSSMGSQAAAAEVLKSLIGDLSVRIAASPDNVAELQILLAGDSAASMSIMKQEDGTWAAVSSLFPNYVVTVKDETVQQLMSSVTGGNATASLSPEALSAVTTPLTELFDEFAQKAGEPETGTFEIDGVVYTTKFPYNVTTKEALTMVLTTLKKIISDEQVAGLFSQYNVNLSPDSLDSALENIANADEADQPTLSLAGYTNENGDSCIEIILEKEDQSMSALFTRVGQVYTLKADILGQAKLNTVINGEAKTFDADLSFMSAGMNVALKVNAAFTDEGGNIAASADIANQGKSANLSLNIKISHDDPIFVLAEGATTIAMEDLMQNTESEEAVAFQTDIQSGLMTTLMTVMQKYPELSQMMNSGAPAQEAVPAE